MQRILYSAALSSYTENLMTVDERDQKLNDEEESILRAKAYDHIRVTFLHKTARDFLEENETGKAFMSDNLDSGLSVCEWYFFAKLAKSKWEPRRSGHDGLRRVLLELERADAETGVAQKRLMEALDDVMARRYGNVELPERKGSHWALMKILADRSPSACEYIYDITGFAAYFWLKHTVLDMVDSPKFRDNQVYKDYMFRYALMSLECYRPDVNPDLFVSLLQRGADPNTIIKIRTGSHPTNITGFEAFLRKMWETYRTLVSIFPTGQHLSMIESLLTIGVDRGLWLTGLETRNFWHLDHFEANCLGEAKPGTNGHDQGETTCRDHHEVNLEFSMSVPSVLKMCLGKEPWHESLQAILAEIGACEKIVLERLHQSKPDRTWTVSSATATSFQEVADACADYGLERERNDRKPPEEVMSVIRKNFDLRNGSGADLKQED